MWLHPEHRPAAGGARYATRRSTTPVLQTRFLDVELGDARRARTTESVSPRGARTERTSPSDLAATVDRTGPWQLPDRLAGLPRAEAGQSVGRVTGGAATYGTGLARFVVLPLPADVARDALSPRPAARPAAATCAAAKRCRWSDRC